MELLKKYFTDFTTLQENQFAALADIYKSWNEKINVISRKDMDSFYEHHVLHSLAIATQFNFKDKSNILDLGTGGGFPGIPLAILFPETNFHFLHRSFSAKDAQPRSRLLAQDETQTAARQKVFRFPDRLASKWSNIHVPNFPLWL